jgi:hypothetical protein
MKLGETLQIGMFTIRCAIRFDNPAFPKYLIFKGDALVGSQFSMPSESDCRWHEIRKGQYAKQEESKKDRIWELNIPKRGRPSNAVRALRLREQAEAIAA